MSFRSWRKLGHVFLCEPQSLMYKKGFAMKFEEMKVLEKSIVPIYEKNCIDGSNFHEPVVNARELWKALESRQDFSTWVKKRLHDIDAEESLDYCLLHEKMEQPSGANLDDQAAFLPEKTA